MTRESDMRMEENLEIHDLIAARDTLRSSIQKTKSIAIAVDEAGLRLKERRQSLACLEASIRDMAHESAVYETGGDLGVVIGPAAAVLEVLSLVYELQDSLEIDPGAGLLFYLNNIKCLDQVLKFLAKYCRLVILWFEDVLQLRKNNGAAADGWCHQVSKVLKVLVELQEKGKSFRQDGGPLSCAFDRLESEYRHLLTESSFPNQNWGSVEASIENLSIPEPVVKDLQAITDLLAAEDRLEKCVYIYAQDRVAKARCTLQALNLDYLEIQLSAFVSVETVEEYIEQWDKHMMFTVKFLLQKEYRFCMELYQKFGPDVWMNCFATIANGCGFIEILNFGCSICKCKKEAVMLLKLLKVFSTLDKLRLDFNELFCEKFCVRIQDQTRDLVKKIVVGAYELFSELLVQVELQRESGPPSNGSIPKLVCFVTEYCNQLLEDENCLILKRILEIYQVWNQVRFQEGVFMTQIHSIIKALESNLDTWAKRYEDKASSYLFMMNNYWYLCFSIKGSKLGDLMGNSWLQTMEEFTEFYAEQYIRESWGKLLVLLSEDGLILFPCGRAIDQDLVKKRISAFYEAFDDMHKKQSRFTVSEKSLRWKIHKLIVEAIVPTLKRYLRRYMPVQETHMENSLKYNAKNLEKLIGSLYEPKLEKYGSSKCIDMIGIKTAV